jgi:hypothetical protein
MALTDALFLTLVNVAACLTFPKLLSKITAPEVKRIKPLQKVSGSRKTTDKLTTFPYCTSYALTQAPSCKFSPNFCDKCSPN